jgi:hypothetical protein
MEHRKGAILFDHRGSSGFLQISPIAAMVGIEERFPL